jgi:tetratricopeptide (TPR) repeat protein
MEVSRPLLTALVGLGRLLLAQGAWEAAAQQADEAEALARHTNNVPALRTAGILRAERDLLANLPGAACTRLLALRASSAPQEHNIDDLPVWLAWAKAELGELAEAGALIAQALTAIRADNRRLVLVGALRVQALVALKQERWTEAESALAEGVAVAGALGIPYAEARLLHLWGVRHVAQGGAPRQPSREEARVQLGAALALFRQLGARRDAVSVEQALGALRSPARRAGPAVPLLPYGDAQPGLPHGGRAGRPLSRVERHAWALEHLRTAGPLSPRGYALGLGVSGDTALRDLQELLHRGLVQAVGTTRDPRCLLARPEAHPAPFAASPLDSPQPLRAITCGE